MICRGAVKEVRKGTTRELCKFALTSTRRVQTISRVPPRSACRSLQSLQTGTCASRTYTKTICAVQRSCTHLYGGRVSPRYLYTSSAKRFSAASSSAAASATNRDLYKILGVDRSATTAQIKSAYYKAAKDSHPDLHPNDPNAAARFRECSEAYEVLGNPESRRYYDSTGFKSAQAKSEHQYQQQQRQQQQRAAKSSWGDYRQSQMHGRQRPNQGYWYGFGQPKTEAERDAHARNIFESLWSDVAIVQEALQSYSTILSRDLSQSWTGIAKGDYRALWTALREHKAPLLAVAVLVGVIRFPALVWPTVLLLLRIAAQNPHALVWLAAGLWRAMVSYAKRQNSRNK